MCKKLFEERRNDFLTALLDFEKEQKNVLHEILKFNKNTEYGQKYSFDKISTIQNFQQNVPITTYENYQFYIDKIKAGNKNVLTKENVLLLEPTGGSSSSSKLIPYTLKLKKAFNLGLEVWFSDLFLNFPELLNKPSYWSITPKIEINHQVSKVKIGFENDLEYLSPEFVNIFQKHILIPPIANSECFIKQTAEYLSSVDNIGLISIWNPSLLFLMLEHSSIHSDFISCWDDANSKELADKLRQMFPNSYIQGKGLLATEGIMTIPLQNIGKVPCFQSHFFEFIDIQTNEIKLLQNLEINRKYSILLTTQGGLYRYKIGDIVRVYDKYKNLPLLEFIGRENNLSDYVGEKLQEEFVINILNNFNINKVSKFYLFAPKKFGNSIQYILYIEPTVALDFNELEMNIEEFLKENFHYHYARKLGQLKKFRIAIIKNGTQQYFNLCQKNGQKLGDIKPKIFSNSLCYDFIEETKV